jgi:hypothetical protein
MKALTIAVHAGSGLPTTAASGHLDHYLRRAFQISGRAHSRYRAGTKKKSVSPGSEP